MKIFKIVLLIVSFSFSAVYLSSNPGGNKANEEEKPVKTGTKKVESSYKPNPELGKKYSQKAEEIHNYFSRLKRIGLFNGAVLYAEDCNIVYKHAFGFGDLRRKRDTLTTESMFQLASVTKTLTSYAVMLLKQRGELSYRDSVRHFFPEFPYENITVYELLTHFSGLPEYFYFTDSLWQDKHKEMTNRDVLDMMIEHEPKKYYRPDYRYNYSNTNYSLLASIIEKVSGKTYKDFMETEIFDELGMNNTIVYDTAWSVIEDFDVMGHKNRWRRIRDFYLNGVVGDKGIYSSVEDLFKWDKAMCEGTLVNKEELEKAFTASHDDLYAHDNYGFGWRIDASDEDDKYAFHAGWWRGFRTFLVRRLKTRQTFIVLTNVDGHNPVSTQTLKSLMERKN